ncbi:unnamed protein product [Amoebophrya sp. A120]|nr:unnamed protein product [Amoebophrya sp. A120]|eukprot:GSA120T00018407001.1
MMKTNTGDVEMVNASSPAPASAVAAPASVGVSLRAVGMDGGEWSPSGPLLFEVYEPSNNGQCGGSGFFTTGAELRQKIETHRTRLLEEAQQLFEREQPKLASSCELPKINCIPNKTEAVVLGQQNKEELEGNSRFGRMYVSLYFRKARNKPPPASGSGEKVAEQDKNRDFTLLPLPDDAAFTFHTVSDLRTNAVTQQLLVMAPCLYVQFQLPLCRFFSQGVSAEFHSSYLSQLHTCIQLQSHGVLPDSLFPHLVYVAELYRVLRKLGDGKTALPTTSGGCTNGQKNKTKNNKQEKSNPKARGYIGAKYVTLMQILDKMPILPNSLALVLPYLSRYAKRRDLGTAPQQQILAGPCGNFFGPQAADAVLHCKAFWSEALLLKDKTKTKGQKCPEQQNILSDNVAGGQAAAQNGDGLKPAPSPSSGCLSASPMVVHQFGDQACLDLYWLSKHSSMARLMAFREPDVNGVSSKKKRKQGSAACGQKANSSGQHQALSSTSAVAFRSDNNFGSSSDFFAATQKHHTACQQGHRNFCTGYFDFVQALFRALWRHLSEVVPNNPGHDGYDTKELVEKHTNTLLKWLSWCFPPALSRPDESETDKSGTQAFYSKGQGYASALCRHSFHPHPEKGTTQADQQDPRRLTRPMSVAEVLDVMCRIMTPKKAADFFASVMGELKCSSEWEAEIGVSDLLSSEKRKVLRRIDKYQIRRGDRVTNREASSAMSSGEAVAPTSGKKLFVKNSAWTAGANIRGRNFAALLGRFQLNVLNRKKKVRRVLKNGKTGTTTTGISGTTNSGTSSATTAGNNQSAAAGHGVGAQIPKSDRTRVTRLAQLAGSSRGRRALKVLHAERDLKFVQCHGFAGKGENKHDQSQGCTKQAEEKTEQLKQDLKRCEARKDSSAAKKVEKQLIATLLNKEKVLWQQYYPILHFPAVQTKFKDMLNTFLAEGSLQFETLCQRMKGIAGGDALCLDLVVDLDFDANCKGPKKNPACCLNKTSTGNEDVGNKKTSLKKVCHCVVVTQTARRIEAYLKVFQFTTFPPKLEQKLDLLSAKLPHDKQREFLKKRIESSWKVNPLRVNGYLVTAATWYAHDNTQDQQCAITFEHIRDCKRPVTADGVHWYEFEALDLHFKQQAASGAELSDPGNRKAFLYGQRDADPSVWQCFYIDANRVLAGLTGGESTSSVASSSHSFSFSPAARRGEGEQQREVAAGQNTSFASAVEMSDDTGATPLAEIPDEIFPYLDIYKHGRNEGTPADGEDVKALLDPRYHLVEQDAVVCSEARKRLHAIEHLEDKRHVVMYALHVSGKELLEKQVPTPSVELVRHALHFLAYGINKVAGVVGGSGLGPGGKHHNHCQNLVQGAAAGAKCIKTNDKKSQKKAPKGGRVTLQRARQATFYQWLKVERKQKRLNREREKKKKEQEIKAKLLQSAMYPSSSSSSSTNFVGPSSSSSSASTSAAASPDSAMSPGDDNSATSNVCHPGSLTMDVDSAVDVVPKRYQFVNVAGGEPASKSLKKRCGGKRKHKKDNSNKGEGAPAPAGSPDRMDVEE